MMCDKLHINSIKRIIYVAPYEYKETVTHFKSTFSYHELVYHFSGDATVHFNGKTLKTQKGVLRYLPKGEITEYIVERKEHGGCILIVFDSDVPIGSEAFVTDMSDNKKVEALFRKAFSCWAGKENGYYFKALSIIYEIIEEIYKKRYQPKNKFKIIEPAVKHISANYLKENISVNHLAELCGISNSYLKKLFIEHYGIPPKKYITDLKMKYAVDLLTSQEFSIGRISDILGYENIYYFSKVFKQNMGISPTEYIKKCKSSK